MASEGNQDGIDIVWGASAISKVIGRSERVTFILLEKGLLPAKKVNGRWVATRSALLAHFTERASA